MRDAQCRAAFAGAALASALLAAPPAAHPATIEITDEPADAAIAVADVTRRGNAVVGTLTNRSADEIHDIRLLIEIPFLWADEARPGEDSPGRASVLTLRGPLAPRGALAFEFTPQPPLPARSDGRFADPRVRVMGFSSIAPH
jgi:hypothetical protein